MLTDNERRVLRLIGKDGICDVDLPEDADTEAALISLGEQRLIDGDEFNHTDLIYLTASGKKALANLDLEADDKDPQKV